MKCYNHPDVEAVSTCSHCGKAICGACSVDVTGKIMCQTCVATGAVSIAPPSTAKPYNPLAFISLGLGLFGRLGCLCGGGFGGLLFGIPAGIVGYIAQRQIAQSGSNQQGKEFALVGLILGIAEAAISLILIFCVTGFYGLGILSSLLGQGR
jgi:hypothetical protein